MAFPLQKSVCMPLQIMQLFLECEENHERYVTVEDFHSHKYDNARASQIQPGDKNFLFHIGHISAYLTKSEGGFVGLGEERYGE